MADIGKLLITLGIVLVLLGFFFTFSVKIPFIGKLPGDILIKKDGFTFYFPLTTSIIISLLVSLILKFFQK
ncbi:MAG: hypothetical protein UV73_C0001G0054 [Candidatus Gottesmanbacteria bacterium GW2011_GWA2_43_14]|uniref:DUF2905 domain-containing protein n=1 Tax=Candidatus Gottesmanbacteria bacterium GW2011_GWA2_43_14 TaxID=1618443 RepID=A0A0G1GIB8_9BACT|nr:MAG: hypothetical protein UV73_C0001G0054 [Candidatus Gottesmanbacteria bacterium GW2011_GWA2_43_14]